MHSARFSGDWYLLQIGSDGTRTLLESHETEASAIRAKAWCEEHEARRGKHIDPVAYTFTIEHREYGK